MLNDEEIEQSVESFIEPADMPPQARALVVHFAVCLRIMAESLRKLAEELADD